MCTSEELRFNTVTRWILKWRYPLLASVVITLVWWMRPTWHPYIQSSPYNPLSALESLRSSASGDPFTEDSIELATFSTFTCDFSTLPDRVRMMRPHGEDYWLFGHGFQDVVTDINWNGGWEVDFANILEQYLRTIKHVEPSRGIFLDLGANIGTHTLRMAAHGYETHAFEPTHANYVLTHCALASSSKAIGTTPVRFNRFGLGASARSVCIESVGYNMGDSVAQLDYTSCDDVANEARIGTLDHYYRTFLRGRKVALVKMDVQGFELIALQHGTELFDSEDAPEVVVFEWEPQRIRSKGNTPSELFRFLEARGYRMFGLTEGKFIDSLHMSDAELEALHPTVLDVAAIKSSWMTKAESAGYEFLGGIIVN